MSYVRVVMVDAKTLEGRDNLFKRVSSRAGEIFPEIQQMLAMPTSETTALSISIYEDKAAADRAVSQRDEELDDKGYELEIAFEGPLKGYYRKDIISAV